MDDEKGMGPQLDSLRERVREVRASILDVVVRIDDIELQQIPQAKVEWQLKIGCWEQALLEAELAGRRARRRLTLMRARANRGERIDVAAIEAQIDEEHVAWVEEVEQARKAYASAMARLASSKTLSPAESKEVKRVYRVLMTRLHPDVCRVEGEDVDGLFLAAKLAYENGNLPMLRSLEAATSSFGEDDGLDDVTDAGELERRLEAATAERNSPRGSATWSSVAVAMASGRGAMRASSSCWSNGRSSSRQMNWSRRLTNQMGTFQLRWFWKCCERFSPYLRRCNAPPQQPESLEITTANRGSMAPVQRAVLPSREWPWTATAPWRISGWASRQSSPRERPHAHAPMGV